LGTTDMEVYVHFYKMGQQKCKKECQKTKEVPRVNILVDWVYTTMTCNWSEL